MSLFDQFGNIDIYLFDQLLKGRIQKHHHILDAGCGGGRNLVYLLKNEYPIWAIDQNPEAVAYTRRLFKEFSPEASEEQVKLGSIVDMPFDELSFDWVICNAVLHFAADHADFDKMLMGMWKCLKPGGIFFARLASDIGLPNKGKALGKGRYFLPDGSERYLATENQLIGYTEKLGAKLIEPLKTTNVQNLRAMTTWVIQKEN